MADRFGQLGRWRDGFQRAVGRTLTATDGTPAISNVKGSAMLCLTRRVGERIIIGDGLVKVTVNWIKGTRVNLAFDCPKELVILREEVANADKEKRS